MRFLFMCGLSKSVEALPFKIWRDYMTNVIQTSTFELKEDNSSIYHRIREKHVHFEDKLHRLKEVTSILELALWKMRMNEKSHQDMATRSQKKIKTDKSTCRQQYRVTCGADVVICHVLPFLINTG